MSLFLVFAFFSCNSQVTVKFTNSSNENYKKLKIIIAEKEFNFESLKKGETTQSVILEKAYEYCFGEVITEKDTLKYVPMICGNEKAYKSGKIDFKITIEKLKYPKPKLFIQPIIH